MIEQISDPFVAFGAAQETPKQKIPVTNAVLQYMEETCGVPYCAKGCFAMPEQISHCPETGKGTYYFGRYSYCFDERDGGFIVLGTIREAEEIFSRG